MEPARLGASATGFPKNHFVRAKDFSSRKPILLA
jgi:hypothetical protein